MTTKQRRDYKQKIKKMLITKGWIKDRWGNLKKEKDGKQYRYKFQSNVLRLEVKNTNWIRLRSYYYKDIKVN